MKGGGGLIIAEVEKNMIGLLAKICPCTHHLLLLLLLRCHLLSRGRLGRRIRRILSQQLVAILGLRAHDNQGERD